MFVVPVIKTVSSVDTCHSFLALDSRYGCSFDTCLLENESHGSVGYSAPGSDRICLSEQQLLVRGILILMLSSG